VDLTRLDQPPFCGFDVSGAQALSHVSQTSEMVTDRMMSETISFAYYCVARAEQYPDRPPLSYDTSVEVLAEWEHSKELAAAVVRSAYTHIYTPVHIYTCAHKHLSHH
jgi:hypothetical protein